MKAPVILGAIIGVFTGPLLPGAGALSAKDFGQFGEAWPIIEPDLFQTIKAKLVAAEKSGKLDDLNARFAQRVKQKVMRPSPVSGIRPATQNKTWTFDPSVSVDRNISDDKGHLIAVAGQRVNPFDYVSLSQELIFIDGDRSSEVSWAMAQGSDREVKIIMVNGSPFEAMKEHKRRFYFDQQGTLSEKFGIRHTPATVQQTQNVLTISEISLDGGMQ
ncbi:type-F conjugative transfer system protein TraW [Altericroceibacterium spongiae]|uniref:Type-F conjugative transfer system protein TraW n=1 Tax=Altericroceibacterium spongiae TaxID=2320269 RepID=A0A420EAI2_9SPHN|nr:type-F conjugative transfer system protein TraW [Altericroceibacterium spongiae]RKF17707.1 type-F conjugative transfer system protein TraW [Altericroceibacterium spongiae]